MHKDNLRLQSYSQTQYARDGCLNPEIERRGLRRRASTSGRSRPKARRNQRLTENRSHMLSAANEHSQA